MLSINCGERLKSTPACATLTSSASSATSRTLIEVRQPHCHALLHMCAHITCYPCTMTSPLGTLPSLTFSSCLSSVGIEPGSMFSCGILSPVPVVHVYYYN